VAIDICSKKRSSSSGGIFQDTTERVANSELIIRIISPTHNAAIDEDTAHVSCTYGHRVE
jgi:hypothetical protein